jgi:hypothetical protein
MRNKFISRAHVDVHFSAIFSLSRFILILGRRNNSKIDSQEPIWYYYTWDVQKIILPNFGTFLKK